MTRLRLAPAAVEDVRDIRRYSDATFGAAATEIYVAGLRRTFAMLRQRPSAGAVEEGIEPVVRRFTYRSHRIFYRLVDDGIVIVRILHHARDARRAMGAA